MTLERWMGTLYLCRDGKKTIGYHTLAFVFCERDNFLIKWGETDKMVAYMKESKAKTAAGGCPELTEFWKIISADQADWDVDLVNKFIDCSGYIGRWYRAQPQPPLPSP